MKFITLAVTTPVIEQVKTVGVNQRQIAIKGASPQLLERLQAARSHNHVVVAVNGVFDLSVGDTRAIWHRHQTAGNPAEDFTSLYELLARRPDQPV